MRQVNPLVQSYQQIAALGSEPREPDVIATYSLLEISDPAYEKISLFFSS